MVKDCITRVQRNDLGYWSLTWNGKPYGPTFGTHTKAEEFVRRVSNRTGLDPHHQTEAFLELMRLSAR